MADKAKGDLHTGHRSRMRRRFMKDGNLDNFQYHEIVEMVLYFSVKRADTNALAHKMLNSYGSFAALAEASVEDIMYACGVSENTAFLISLIPHLAKRYNDSKEESAFAINSKNDVFRLLHPLIGDERIEGIFAICLNSSHEVIRILSIAQGTKNNAEFSLDELLEQVVRYKAAFVIIAHNHPGGTMYPSEDDVAATKRMKETLGLINVVLLDHVILCGKRCFSFAQNGICGLQY